MKIDDALINKLEKLSKLKLDFSEKEILKQEIESMVGMFDKISSVDTKDVLPLMHMTETVNVMRDDVVKNELSNEKALKNAPSVIDQYFAVPKVIE